MCAFIFCLFSLWTAENNNFGIKSFKIYLELFREEEVMSEKLNCENDVIGLRARLSGC